MKSYNDYIVNTRVLRENALNIKRSLNKRVKFCAIVKANAYGLGVETVCKTLFGIADFWGVANIKEALSIRLFDKTTKILILGVVSNEDLKLCAENNISISVTNLYYLEVYNKYAENKINIHLQINTGLNRFGFRKISEFRKALKLIRESKYLHLEGVYSHFATKANDVAFIKKQFIRFNQFKKYVDSSVICHISNSYATTLDKRYHLDMVRNGYLLYGIGENILGNNFVLSIKSRIINVFDAKKCDTIGYDRTYKVCKNMRIGVVPIGYADGFDRRLSNNFRVLIDGKYCNVVGMICMDVFMVDISNIRADIGSEVVILGKQGSNDIRLQDYARALNTSPYEILLKFNSKRMNYVIK